VVVERFGYDRPGRVVKLDHRKKQAQVMIGQVKWDVPINELIPQLARTPDVPDDSKKKGRIDYAGLDRP
jgi:DNA mismatch repair protein MutS2